MLFEGGALLPTLGPSVAGNWAYAGILLNDFAILTIAVGTSTFQNLANGIVATRSNININRAAIFRNILPRGYGGLPDGNAIFARNDLLSTYNVSVTGFGQTGAATFDNCQNGVMSIASNLTVTANNMLNIKALGIESSLAQKRRISITQNQIQLHSNLGGAGIHLAQNDPTLSTLVSNNILEIGLVQVAQPNLLNAAQGGIIVNENTNGHSLNIIQNTIRLFRGSFAISLTTNRGARVIDNTIDFRHPFPIAAVLFPTSRTGVALHACDGINLRCNHSLSNLNGVQILQNATGINITDSRVTADCNDMARTDTGMVVNGPNCAGSLIRGNSFQRHNIGLYYSGTAVTSAQSHAGNRWLGTWLPWQRGARHDGNPALSLYSVSSNNTPLMPPNRIPAIWFTTGSGIPFSCLNNSCLPTPVPLALNNVDVATVNNQIPQNPIASPWELRRGLLNKLDKNPIFQLNPAMGQFYNTYQNQTIGTVVETADARENTMVIDTADAIILEQHRATYEMIIDSLSHLDSLYLVGALSNNNWSTQRQQWLQQWELNHNNASTFCISLFGICQTQSQQAQAINATISHTNTPEENERLVNEIYLQTVALGIGNFDTLQIQTLYNIAHQCPEFGGTAVYRARSIYALIEYDTYDDACDNLPQLRMGNLSSADTCYSEVRFLNPSLEGIVGGGQVPSSWTICTWSPDTHPAIPEMPTASDGNTYVGQGGDPNIIFLESFQQILVDTLKAGVRYGFDVDLLAPQPPLTNSYYGTLSIWLGNSTCSKQELVYAISITDTVWTTYSVIFTPTQNYNHIILSGEVMPYFSYILIDNIRPIPLPFGCDTISSITPTLPDRTDNLGNDVYTNTTTTKLGEFKIYPNPNQVGLLTVEWQKNISNGVIIVLDALGREVGTYNVANNIISQQIDIQHLPSGYYSVLLREDAQVMGREKLIVIKQ